MIQEITFAKIQNAGFTTKEIFSIRKATNGLSPSVAFGVLEDMWNETKDSRFEVLMQSLVTKIRVQE